MRKPTFVSVIETENNFEGLEIVENSFDSSDNRRTTFAIMKVKLIENRFDSFGKDYT